MWHELILIPKKSYALFGSELGYYFDPISNSPLLPIAFPALYGHYAYQGMIEHRDLTVIISSRRLSGPYIVAGKVSSVARWIGGDNVIIDIGSP